MSFFDQRDDEDAIAYLRLCDIALGRQARTLVRLREESASISRRLMDAENKLLSK
jgi:hypothetical protein